MKKLKLVLAVLLIATFIIPVAAVQAQEEQITIRLAWWGGQSRNESMLAVADAYMETHPNVRIECEYSGYSDYQTKLAAQTAAGVEPDIFWQDIGNLGVYLDKNIPLDLTGYVGNGLDVTNIAQTLVDLGKYDDILFGVANGVNASCIIYNPDLFAQAGIEKPDKTWTWENLESIAKQIKDKLGIYAFSRDYTAGTTNVQFYLREMGYDLYNADNTALGFDDPQLLADLLAMDLRWQDEQLVPNLDQLMQLADNIEDTYFAKGQAALDFGDSNAITSLYSVLQIPLDFLPLPGPDNDKGMFVKPACYTLVSSRTEYPEVCVDFLNYFINDLTAGMLFNAQVGVPISSEVSAYLASSLEGDKQICFQNQVDFIAMLNDYSSSANLLYPSKHSAVSQLLQDARQKVLYGIMSPEEAAEEFVTQANLALSE